MGMDDVSITYEKLYGILRKEKDSHEIQELDVTFFSDVVGYLKEKTSFMDEASGKTDLFSAAERENTGIQLKNIRRIVKELYDRRESKIIAIAMNKSRTDSDIIDVSALLPEEKALYSRLVKTMIAFRKGVYWHVVEMREPFIPSVILDSAVPELKNKPSVEKSQELVDEVNSNEIDDSKLAQSVQQQTESSSENTAAEQAPDGGTGPSNFDSNETTNTENEPSLAETLSKTGVISSKGGVSTVVSAEPGVTEEGSKHQVSEDTQLTIKFLQETTKFVGKELEIYGPYSAGDIGTLPADIAKVLIARGSAQAI